MRASRSLDPEKANFLFVRDRLGIRGGQRISVSDVVDPNRRAPERSSL